VRAPALYGVAVAFAESVQFTAAERCAAFNEGVTLREAVNVLAQLERHTSTARYVDNKQAGFTDPDDYQALVNRAQLGDETTVALTLTAFQLEQCSAIVDAYARTPGIGTRSVMSAPSLPSWPWTPGCRVLLVSVRGTKRGNGWPPGRSRP